MTDEAGKVRVASLALTVLLAVCACARGDVDAVAQRIEAEGSATVLRVTAKPADYLDEAQVFVWLQPGTSEAAADEFWCEVVVPAGGTDRLDTDRIPVSLWDSTGDIPMARQVQCPPRSSSGGS